MIQVDLSLKIFTKKYFKSEYHTNMRCLVIPIEKLTINDKIGSGQFGQVFKGVYKQTNHQLLQVAVKVTILLSLLFQSLSF